MAEHARQGDAKEFVLAKNVGLFQKPGQEGFGPSRWQQDATTEFLAGRWHTVIDVLKLAQANPRADVLFAELLNSAKANLDYAKIDWAKLKSEGYANSKYGQGFETVFEQIELELLTLNPREI